MHYRLIVTFDKKHAKNSLEARGYAFKTLGSDPTFCYADAQPGLFASGVCDWFVIGGRWSGELTNAKLDQKKIKKVNEEFEEEYGWWVGGKTGVDEKKRKLQYESVFNQYFPNFKGELPAWRDHYQQLGYEDDAAIVDKVLYESILKKYKGDRQGWSYHKSDDANGEKLYTWKDLHFADLDGDYLEKGKDVIGKKWIVVIDYHC